MFEESDFWESLITNLAERDFLEEIKPGSLPEISLEDQFEIIGRHEENGRKNFQNMALIISEYKFACFS